MKRILAATIATALPFVLGACELAPKTSSQHGYRGTGMNTIKVTAAGGAEAVPAPPYETPGIEGQRASEVYENVPVLGNVSVDQFNYTMAALTEWVSPEQGCNYCHNPANMASDEVYTKVVARRMLQMTQALNQNWSNHVASTGVTCWTCHRGQPVPTAHWSFPGDKPKGIKGNRNGQNQPLPETAFSSLPVAAVASYLSGDPARDMSIRVNSKGMHPGPDNRVGIMEAEHSYSVMMHVSSALGVNCTFCHNSQSFQKWTSSNPQRAVAFHGVNMVRDINSQYITPLASVFPANRKGVRGDPFKVNCTTCHQGQNKPMGGYQMAKDYPALRALASAPAAMSLAPAAAPAAAAMTPAQAGAAAMGTAATQ
jgi:photosynthetic reaction center cytochrome c subunit